MAALPLSTSIAPKRDSPRDPMTATVLVGYTGWAAKILWSL